MKILLVNKFFYRRGGSEASFFDTAGLLAGRGHDVLFFSMQHPLNAPSAFSPYFVSRVDFDEARGPGGKLRAAGRVLYSLEARRKLRRLLADEKPDLAHLHNIHHQISPSFLPVFKEFGIPVVFTLHDYKLVCPIYTLYREGRICEECLPGKFRRCLIHKCCKGSYAKSALAAAEMILHRRILHLYDSVDVFISPSRFLQDKLAEAGFKDRIVHLPNFIDLGSVPKESGNRTGGGPSAIIFFGRLYPEKGVGDLLKSLAGLDIPCSIVGDGPLRSELDRGIRALGLRRTRLLGYKSPEELAVILRGAAFAVVPSTWYENNPRAILEAYAFGKPVLGARIGGIPELVQDQVTGLTFEPGNTDDLKDKIRTLWADPSGVRAMGQAARKLVEEHFSQTEHYARLMTIYARARART